MIFGQNVETFAFWNDYVPAKLTENFSVFKEDLPEDLDTYMRTLLFNKRTSGKWLLMARVNAMTGVEVWNSGCCCFFLIKPCFLFFFPGGARCDGAAAG